MDSNVEMINSIDSSYIKIYKKRGSRNYAEYKPLIGKINEKSSRDHVDMINNIKLNGERVPFEMGNVKLSKDHTSSNNSSQRG